MKKGSVLISPVMEKAHQGRSNGFTHRRQFRKNRLKFRCTRQCWSRKTGCLSTTISQNVVMPSARGTFHKAAQLSSIQMGPWFGGAWSQVGGRHLQALPPVPCQDASAYFAEPRTTVVLADGAGSSQFSHLGAEAVVRGTRRMLFALNPWLTQLLDEPMSQQNGLLSRVVEAFAENARMTLIELSDKYRHPFREFRCTYLAVIAGQRQMLWFKIGDGEIYFRKIAGELLVGGGGKGEFANQTHFLHPALRRNEIEYGLLAASDICAAGVMSDGAAERLVSQNREKLAGALKIVEDRLVEGKKGTPILHQLLNTPELWLKTTGDDRSLAVMARKPMNATP